MTGFGIYGSNAFLLIAVVILGIDLYFVIGCRNINYLKHYQMVENGVDEGIYVSLGGMEQYVLVRGMNTDNPVLIYLHGGPSSPDTYATYGFSDELIDEYTMVAWDQRGCGRTYFHNIDTDSENTAASFEQAQEDLDELVDYVRERFGKEQVVILGHSYGTILGSEYALEHPDKVSAYIGVAQVVSLEKTEVYSYEDALQKAIKADDDTAELTNAFEKFQDSDSLIDMLQLRSLVSAYHPVDSIKEYSETITAPEVRMELIEGCGHEVQYSLTTEFADVVLNLLDGIE
jgi:predicted esterase